MTLYRAVSFYLIAIGVFVPFLFYAYRLPIELFGRYVEVVLRFGVTRLTMW